MEASLVSLDPEELRLLINGLDWYESEAASTIEGLDHLREKLFFALGEQGGTLDGRGPACPEKEGQ